uniref:Chitin-binding type-2 domain-containing protein n=1 Tax=Anopheles farauti TaxID=69004 RepID=A0A182Q0V0_9DIPT
MVPSNSCAVMKLLLLVLAVGGVVQLQALQVCEQQAPGTIVGSPTNCSEFYMCRSGRPVLFACPYDMYFDVDTSACGYEAFCAENDVEPDWDPSRPLGPEYPPILTGPSQLVPGSGVCRGASIGSIRLDATGCSAFYQCTKAGPLRLECPIGTLFDSNRLLCEAADLTSCAYVPVKPIAPAPSVPQLPGPSHSNNGDELAHLLDVLCYGKKNGEKQAHPIKCDQYFLCNGRNKAQVLKCPQGTAYNKKRKVCDFTYNVSC